MPGPLAPLDWAIVFAYIGFAVWVGARYAKRAGESVDEYFLSGRSLPWWVIGTSMVATSFAADTPLLITGWVRDDGIWRNWVWWCYLIGGMLQVFLFARWWRRAGVMTKAELVELRYGGAGADVLRGVLGCMHAFVTNTMTLCWVMLAAAKISEVLFEVDKALGLTIACAVAMSYSLLAGFWGVVVTDLVQFVFAMVGAIALAWISWSAVGGTEGLYGAIDAGIVGAHHIQIVPHTSGEGFWTAAVAAFAVYLGVSWWAVESVDGTGTTVQRVAAAKSPRHGMFGVLWFNIAHYALRPWCWILVGLASLIALPHRVVETPTLPTAEAQVVEVAAGSVLLQPIESRASENGAVVASGAPIRVSLTEGAAEDWQPIANVEPDGFVAAGDELAATDSEYAYMVMMVRYLPVGLLGLVAASLIAAFMSTIDTHVNLAASFFVNDIYRRFLRPDRASKEYVLVARLASVVVLVIGAAFAMAADSVRDLFVFFLAFLAGVGPIYVLRWLWWRVRASTEITAMTTSAIVSSLVTWRDDIDWHFGPLAESGALSAPGRVVVVAAASLLAAAISLALTRTPDPKTLVAFYAKTRPFGAWGPVRALLDERDDAPARSELLPALLGASGGIALVYGLMLGIGFSILGQNAALAICGAAVVIGGAIVAWAVTRLGDES